MMARARPAVSAPEDDLLAEVYRRVTEQQVARFSAGYDLPAGQGRFAGWLHQQGTSWRDWDADRAVTVLYGQRYQSLAGLAALLVGRAPVAEELVQDSFVALHAAWPDLTGRDGAISFLYWSVVQGSRNVVPGQQQAASWPGEPAVVTALRALPSRQREAVVLRCCAELADGQIAAAMGVSTAQARRHLARAMAALGAEFRADGSALPVRQGEPG